jgi:integrase
MHRQYGDDSEWFFPGKSLDIHIPKTSVDRKFNEFWNTTHASAVCDKKPTVHCLRHAFVIRRVNLWMEKDLQLQVMMPYLSSYLGHKGPIETYYYYHQVADVFKTVRRKDSMSARVIPEVQHEE